MARGEELDARTDLFSFGVVLYEMCTGISPFSGNTNAVILESILNRVLPTAGVSVIVTAAACPCNIWNRNLKPTNIDSGPDNSVELGVKFKADLNGTITGIRFYKGSNNTGTHVGSLWNSSGKLLASATFTNETPSGWQEVSFSTPVKITAATVYVASYHTTVGHYSDDQNYFASSGVDNPPLHALENGVKGFDGVYTYSSTTAFPSSGFNFSNYWVDVAFVP